MRRKPIQEWMILLTYLFLLILITVHSGYLCQKLWFIIKQFFPLILAGVLAFVLNHPYKYLCTVYKKKGKVPEKAARVGSILTVYLGLAGVVAAAGGFALPRLIEGIRQFAENQENYMQVFEKSAQQLMSQIGLDAVDITPVFEGVSEYLGRVDQMLDEFLPRMARLTTGVFRGTVQFGIIIVLSIYMLYDKEHLKKQSKRVYMAYVPKQYNLSGLRMISTISEIFNHFVVGQGLESCILGILCFVGMLMLRLEYSGFVSLVVGMTAFIPLLGAYIGGGLGFLLLLFISVRKAVIFFVFFVILQQIENNFIYPRIVGRRTGLPGIWVLASVTVGGGLFGIIGMILSVPFATLIYTVIERGIQIRECRQATEEAELRQKNEDKIS